MSRVKSGTRMAWVSILNKEVDSTWVTNHNGGLLDISTADDEITTIPFIQSVNPEPKSTTNQCVSS
jgi:hypothetical protein